MDPVTGGNGSKRSAAPPTPDADVPADTPHVTRAVERTAQSTSSNEWSSAVGPVTERELAALFDELPEMVMVLDAEARVRHANRTLLEAMGYRLEAIVGTSVFEYIHPDDLDYNANAWENRQAHPGEVGLTVQGRGRDAAGSWRAVEFVARGLSGEVDGRPTMTGMVVTMRELGTGAALSDTPATLRSLIDRTSDIVLLVGGDGLLAYANRRLTTGYGHDHDRLVGSPWTTILRSDEREPATRWLSELVAGGDRWASRARFRLEDPDGTLSVVEWHGANHLADPLIQGVILNGRDVTHLAEMEEQLHRRNEQLAHAARHDPLTGLLNRQAFVEEVDDAIRRHRRDGSPAEAVVLFCDLDGFKAVNDDHGHEAGDRVLAAVASRLSGALSGDDLVARYGGDEFTVLLAGSPSHADVEAVVTRLRGRLAEPVALGGPDVSLGVSVGVARAPYRSAEVDELLRQADLAMYERKRSRE